MNEASAIHRNGTESAVGTTWIEDADLSSQRTRTKFAFDHPELLHPEIVSSLAALVPRLVKSDRSKALDVAELAVMIASHLDEETVAQSLRARGNALHGLGRNKAAVEQHRRALHLFRSAGNADQVARTLSSSIQPLILQGHYDQALSAAREAREIFSRHGNLWRLARLELNLGNIFDRQDRLKEALACYENAYRYLSTNVADDPEAVAAALHNIAVLCVRLNDFRKALATYERARQFAAEHEMHALVAQTDYNIASLYYLRGDYSRAISMLREARENCRSSGDQYHFALCQLDLSEIYLELNLSQEAAETAEQASSAFQQLGMQYERGKSLANVAIALGQQEQPVRALQLFLQARRILARERNKVLPSLIDLYRAVVLVDEKRKAEAYRLCIAALKSFQRFKLANKAVVCRLLLARVHLLGNDPVRARQQCARALKSLRGLESPVLSCQAHALMGQIEAALGRERRSYQAYGRASEFLERLRNSIHGEELKISFMKDRVKIYEALVALTLKRGETVGELTETFGYIQQAKSRSLLDALSTSRSASWLAPQDHGEQARRIRELREELNWYFHKIEMARIRQAPQQELVSLRRESRQREIELLKLLREHTSAENTPPDQQTATPLAVDQIRRALPAGALILEYFQVQDRIVVLLLSHDQMKIVPVAEVSQVSTVLELLQFQLSRPQLAAEYVKALGDTLLTSTRAHLEDLYKLLIDPVRKWLIGTHLVIAPHGILHRLPFQALFDGSRYLIDEFTISYAPSASVYAVCQARSGQSDGASLVLGIPDEAVPYVEEEVKAVASRLPNAELFIGSKATVECLREKGPHRRFIHIATHGYFRRDNPLFSGIRLGNSYLSLYDLYQLQLRAELVALSGCSTGLNVVAGGDELLGLARGLIHVGAQTSLLTLWDVQDRSTAELMKYFYDHLASASSKGQALQKAMQQLRSQYPHPYYWAPFILVGKA